MTGKIPEIRAMSRLELLVEIERWPLVEPFSITGYTVECIDVLVVMLKQSDRVGRGEAAGVYYRNDRVDSMRVQVEALRETIESGISRQSLQKLLPAGGARNALDCALWDLETRVAGQPAWQLAGLERPKPILTTFTCGADMPERMAAKAIEYGSAKAIKLKLTGERSDADRVRAVRDARPDVWLGVDANQGFTRTGLDRLMPALVEAHVALVEQPFPIGQDAWLDGLQSPIPIAADESVQTLADVEGLVGRFNVVNVKLDKCGGLTEGLAIARRAQALGLDAMVGNMMGTSLAMAPAFLVGQLCKVVDLDGPIFIKADRTEPVQYSDGYIVCPKELWGCI